MENVILLGENRSGKLSQLPKDTKDYFQKLPNYDTLRFILSKRVILVEGPADDLIIQKAYHQKHNKLPLDDGIDVISVVFCNTNVHNNATKSTELCQLGFSVSTTHA